MAFAKDWSGQQIGDYRLLRCLGAGGFGEVYQAEDQRSLHQVAIKLIKASITQRQDLKAFLNEARSIRLHHPHIVPLLDFGLSEQDLPFLVMEYMAGGTLRDRYPKGSRVPLSTVVGLVTQLASALQYAHDRHLVHRDVKPENMLCRSDGRVLLSDFGISAVAHATDSVSAYQAFGGTLPYMAPEQHAGKPRPASGQYALAVVAYEWLAGVRPFQGSVPELVAQHLSAPPPSLVGQVPALPAEVEQVIFKALSKEPQQRFARVDDFAVALQAASQPRVGSPAFTRIPGVPEQSQKVLPDQVTGPRQAGEVFSMRAVSPTWSGSKATADQPQPMERWSAGGPGTQAQVTTATPWGARNAGNVVSPARQKKRASRGMLFTIGLLLLVVLSGSSLPLFKRGLVSSQSGASRTATSSLAQATATAAAQACAVVTARHGVMFGFDAAHTHNNPCEQTLGPGNVSRLKLLWSFATGNDIDSSPAVAGGLVYVGSVDHKLYAFDASCRANCQPLWSYTTGGYIASPAVAGGLVYVGSYDRKLYAFGLAG